MIAFVKEKGGVTYAEKVMRTYQQSALSILDDFEDSTYKRSLIGLVNYTIDRKK